MTCNSCGYRFILDPKKPPHLSDMAVKKAVENVSGFGQYAFTYHQLYAGILRVLRKKEKKNRIGCALSMGLLMVFFFFMGISLEIHLVIVIIAVALLLCFVLWFMRRPVGVDHSAIANTITQYRAVHPLEGLADGRGLKDGGKSTIDSELLKHAPERMLIVERDDVAEMLIRNGFHLDNKALVVSANRYPAKAFAAFREFLARYPDIPIAVLHDASKKGHRLKTDLLADPEWGLEGKKVTDLGLHPSNVERLKTPVWVPETGSGNKKVLSKGKAVEAIEDGYYMPLDIAGPRALMGSMGLAMVVGSALLSDDLLAEQQRGMVGGGFG